VEDGKVTAKGVLAKLAGIATPEDARLVTGSEVAVGREELPELGPGVYSWSDLEGLAAVGRDDQPLGRIEEFRTTPAGPVVVIRGERQHWVALCKERIVKVTPGAARRA